MKLSYTTLACPDWNLQTICRMAVNYGYDGIDFRGYLEEIDITRLPLFHGQDAPRMIREHGLLVSGVSSSIKICDADSRTAALEEARRTIDVCHNLQARHVRIFGGGDSAHLSKAQLAETGRETMAAILALDGAQELSWNFETHDAWVAASDCRLLLDAIPFPSFNLLWDLGNNFMFTAETAEDLWAQAGKRLAYTHIKDAKRVTGGGDANSWQYVLPGEGELPLAEAVHSLQAAGFAGWYVLEHEKRWHPNLDSPELVIPAYARWMRELEKR
ncbi:MAG: sugar phosphate isomerase/epimerase [Anaerolineae bacterium]|nr:sugar phosphate isomerase/epimerase [Anaerolineae bacterium]